MGWLRNHALVANFVVTASLADSKIEKHNAAQAEYNRLAALVGPEAPEIPPTQLCLHEGH
jgi:hypothetical protein